MGILSDLIRAPIGQAPSRGRGMGAIGARPDLPMPPRRKGGLAGLLQRVKGRLPERPISTGGVGGGNIQPTQSPLQQAFEKIQNSIQPVPVLPGQQGMRFDPITRKMVPAEGPDMSGKIPVSLPLQPPTDDPLLRPRVDAIGGQQPIPQVPLAPLPITPPTLSESFRAITKRPEEQMFIERLDNEPIRDITNNFGGVNLGGTPSSGSKLDDLPPGLRIRETPPTSGPVLPPGGPIQIRPDLISSNRISDQIRTDDRPIFDPRIGMPPPPLPPQDFGFGPGIMPPTPDFLPFADDYALQRGDPGYQSNDSDRFRRDRERAIRSNLLPPKRDDFMSVGGPGGGVPDPRLDEGVSYLGGSPTFNEQGSVTDPIVPTVDPIQPAPTEPAAVAPTAGADPTQTQMPMGAIDPVLLQQATSETLTDPLIRSLYFGTQDSPGFYQQLQQAGANLIGSDVPLQQTAGLSPLELLARQKAVAGLGGFEPFLQQNRDLVDQAISQSRRAEELQDPYYTQAEEIYKDTMGAYDPSMTQQFYNPYEDAVVQQTIEDVMKAGDKQDIASRAREISAGAFGGSRARLGAEERRQDLGEGLAQALGNIRSQGFQSAQATGLGEFARQQAAKRTGAQGLMGIGVGRGSAASQLGSQLAGYGSQIGGIGQTQEQMRAGQRGELSGYGGIGRGIAETGLGRIFEQQVGQQYRPMQTLGQIGSMLPGYQASQTQIDSGYGMPTDPTAAGLGAAFSAYGALAPRQGQT